MKDGIGIYGLVFAYALLFAMMGSSLLLLLYFWRQKSIDFSEDPKYQMMEDDDG
ncbi:MAG: hypothetical protein WD595_06835 [Waddliaceae bacterium]